MNSSTIAKRTQGIELVWTAFLTGHVTAAAPWWWLRPGGFAAGTTYFWVNSVLPWGVTAAALAARCARAGSMPRLLLHGVFAVAWFSAAVSARFIFPVSFIFWWLPPLAVAAAMCALWFAEIRAAVQRWPVTVAAIFVGGLGAVLPISQRAPAAGTTPGGVNPQLLVVRSNVASTRPVIALGDDARFEPAAALVTLYRGRMTLGVQPVLTFVSRSPDGCWSAFARRAERNGPARMFLGCFEDTNGGHVADYRDDTASSMRVAADAGVCDIRAETTLLRPIASHLNTFTELTVAGHRALTVAFSPCAGRRIDFVHSEYPSGKPARFAYLDRAGSFHVAQASNAEKGPFHDLASAPLAPGEPLTMTLYDGDAAVFKLRFDDRARQASTELSPTAGWGVPQNSIEFSLADESPRSMANVFVTLAATSVGRGFDTVWHAAGTYRNHVVVMRR